VNGSARFGVGLLVGVLLAWGGAAVLSPGATTPEPTAALETTAVGVTVTQVPWFETGEVVVESTVLLPRDLTVGDDVALFEYDLAGLSPALEEPETTLGGGDAMVLPATWRLLTTTGVAVESTTGPDDRRVRFELPIGAAVDEILLTEWRVATPLGGRAELAIESGAIADLETGTLLVTTVLDQANSTIVQIDLDQQGGVWASHVLPAPVDPRWRVGPRERGLQLTWEGADAPDHVVLVDTAVDWRPVQGSIPVYGAGGE
jgi:hypothetical protein